MPRADDTPSDGVTALLRRIEALQSEADVLRARIRDLERLADTDPLVGLVNRRAFVRDLERMVAYAHRHERPLGVVYVDINGFKAINDRLGHAIGDMALLHVARVLRARLRASDLIGRMGGDEFCVGLPEIDASATGPIMADLKTAVADAPTTIAAAGFGLSVSAGAAMLTSGETADQLIERADAAMYADKRAAAAS